MEPCDAVVVGAGPAGLTAAIYLARFRRRVLVLGAGPSRASWIPESHNTPGFPHGVGGTDLLARLTEQAHAFGVHIREALVRTLTPAAEGFEISTGARTIRAPAVLLATGVRDRMPELPGIEAAVCRSVVRMCPICDAYEATGKRIAVLGDGGLAQREAAFLRTYSDDVTVIGSGDGRLSFDTAAVRWTPSGDAAPQVFDHLYLALGCEPQTELAVRCGARCDDSGNLTVDPHQMTSVEGLYAAGDVVRGLNQISVATGEAAIAATAMHNRLRGQAP
ncbi:NAD(P)/FAD-dependent oxidoreductase [Phenylobacterium sp.]|uniref:NAD(P)/FAD-dependent oxidoreductase n=1 Tax=Phenylobacterium sp. TaxID=1871053 RepID=UPI001219F10C|nr:NAD(P)/FAD-dependent oxidoreductase [Phenylobacterium sp.]THD62584.1 MAG: NAD(P)/FAD-dependent oxidoreductase [Phenylobacterium sp.]